MQRLQLQATEEELERQRGVEEEERKRRGCVDMQRDRKQGNGSVENQEGTLQSTKDCRATEEEPVKEESGADVQPELHTMTEPPKTQQDCKTLENCVHSEIEAS